MLKVSARISGLLAFASMVASVGQAAAATTYPGMECRATAGGTSVVVDTDGHAENSGSSTATVICPVVGDPLVVSTSANVFVTDQSSAGDVCCSARAKNTGLSVSFSANACTSGGGSGSVTLTMTPPAVSFTFTHLFYQCSLPAVSSGLRSEVRTYRY
jgi:hypothetical protein